MQNIMAIHGGVRVEVTYIPWIESPIEFIFVVDTLLIYKNGAWKPYINGNLPIGYV